jgi:taurine dioxygenase
MTITQQKIAVTPLSGYTGAEITGVDLSQPLDQETIVQIRKAFLLWKVVFFRDQTLDHKGQIRFGNYFGDVTPAHPYEGETAPSDYPEIHTVSPDAYRQRYGDTYQKKESNPNGPGWHADVTPLINPPAASILRAESVPPFGGDTQFTNVAKAYEGLSEPIRELINGLRAEHRFGHTYSNRDSNEPIANMLATKPLAAIHPVVRVHPETGERVIYVNPGFTRLILDVSPRESRHLLDLLFEQIAKPEYTVRFKWEPGSLAFWDNRAALHLAPKDFEHLGYDRILHRITLVGDVPVGIDGQPSQVIDGEPFLAA